ncbi:hypothetical protein [Chondromyces crocatus]|uniref:hypothetical protein n=1 Tax=Chondromyces crocatus TaxID=52 RepID=UPI00067DDF16|nr:hypothetical protein [Chondromyces crocatus]
MRDILILAILIVSFATLLTVHVALAGLLIARVRPRWQGLLAFLVPPLAPIYGFREGFRRTSALWLTAVLVYTLALSASYIF